MRYSSRQYAEALYESLKGKEEAARKPVLARFLGILRKDRRTAALPDILRHYERHALATEGKVKVHIETPDGASDHLKREIEKALGKPAAFSERVEPKHLAGVLLLVNDSLLIDATARHRLEGIFKKD